MKTAKQLEAAVARPLSKSKTPDRDGEEEGVKEAQDRHHTSFDKLVDIHQHTSAQTLYRYLCLNHHYIQLLLGNLENLANQFSEELNSQRELFREEYRKRQEVILSQCQSFEAILRLYEKSTSRSVCRALIKLESRQRKELVEAEAMSFTNIFNMATEEGGRCRESLLVSAEKDHRNAIEKEEVDERQLALKEFHDALHCNRIESEERAERTQISTSEAEEREALRNRMDCTLDAALNDEELKTLDLAATFYGKEYQELMKTNVGPRRAVNVTPFIGFSLSDNVKPGHLVVDGVFEKGPAYQVGIDIDHELIAVGGESVNSISEVRELISKCCYPGRITRFTLRDTEGNTYSPMVWVMTADELFSDKKYFFDVNRHKKKESTRAKREWKPPQIQK